MTSELPTTRTAMVRPAISRISTCALTLGVLLLCGPPAPAAPRIAIPEGLKASAMVCLAEALRLCPNALAAKDRGVSCIVGKRRLLSKPCQGIYDQALRLLNGRDIHIDLRPPKKN